MDRVRARVRKLSISFARFQVSVRGFVVTRVRVKVGVRFFVVTERHRGCCVRVKVRGCGLGTRQSALYGTWLQDVLRQLSRMSTSPWKRECSRTTV